MELRRYALLLLRWSWMIVLGAALAGGAAFVTSKRQVPTYEASTIMLISQSKANTLMDANTLYVSDRLAATYAELMRRQPVMEEVISRLGLEISPGALSAAVKVTPIRNTQLIQLSVENSNPELASVIANEIPKVFIAQNATMQATRFADTEASLKTQIQSSQETMTRMQDSIQALLAAGQPDQVEIDRWQRDLTETQANYSTLFRSYDQLRMDMANQLDTLIVTEQAQPARSPIRPRTMQNTLVAAAVGALLALGMAFLIEYLDDVIKNPDDVQATLGLTALAAVPAIDDKEIGSELPVVANTRSAATEAYRILRTNLQFASVGEPLRSLLVTSPSPSEGKSMSAANLGAAAAQGGRRVILVDADLHRPRLHRIFKLRNNTGVTTALLRGDGDPEGELQDTGVENLRVLTSGPLPPNAAELLGTVRMRELIGRLEGMADLVIYDSPPTMALSDAAILSTQLDGVLLVLDATSTRREMARRAVAGLQQVQARIVGVLLNRIPTRGAGSYYYYNSHYGQYYGSEDGHGDDGVSGSSRNSSGRRRGLAGLFHSSGRHALGASAAKRMAGEDH